MGTMNWTKRTCAVGGGLALLGHLAHEAHQNADYIARPLAAKPTLDAVIYVRLAHGEEPDAPGAPLQLRGSVAVSSSSVSSTVTLAGISAVGMAGNFVWNPAKNHPG
jgi:hypothetical protein